MAKVSAGTVALVGGGIAVAGGLAYFLTQTEEGKKLATSGGLPDVGDITLPDLSGFTNLLADLPKAGTSVITNITERVSEGVQSAAAPVTGFVSDIAETISTAGQSLANIKAELSIPFSERVKGASQWIARGAGKAGFEILATIPRAFIEAGKYSQAQGLAFIEKRGLTGKGPELLMGALPFIAGGPVGGILTGLGSNLIKSSGGTTSPVASPGQSTPRITSVNPFSGRTVVHTTAPKAIRLPSGKFRV